MKVIAGLGNPGPRYETTRHNAGFLVLDLLAEEAGIQWDKGKKEFLGEIGKGSLLGETCLLLKPMTFYNDSGRAVGAVMRYFKVPEEDLVVLHDDIDVPNGKVKMKVGGGHGGNNGIRSIIEEAGLRDFARIKLGTGRPSSGSAAGNNGNSEAPRDSGSSSGGSASPDASGAARHRDMSGRDWVLSRLSDAELLHLQQGMLDEVKVRIDGIFKKAAR